MTSELEKRSSDDLEKSLWIASRRYMRGEISMLELEEVERRHFSQLRDAIIDLAKQGVVWHQYTIASDEEGKNHKEHRGRREGKRRSEFKGWHFNHMGHALYTLAVGFLSMCIPR